MAHAGPEYGLSRRSFVTGVVGILGGIIAAVVGLPAIGYLLSPSLKSGTATKEEWVPLGPIEELVVGEPRLFAFTRTKQVGWERTANSYGVYVVRKAGDSYDVFSNVCTHLSCRVSWKEDENEYVCPCHDGRFAKDGSIISGPQPRPLNRFEYKIEEGTIYIHLVEA
ncbi:MAG: ubiquinol-cytochrome c reductase iron-sulfur subunit [Anaerolineales bacterium]|jgi:menaquinol-cytochrome c reductase iron-sulfur subunit